MNDSGEVRQRLTREQAKEQTRQRLLEAATSVVALRGFSAASVDEIAETAGYTIGAVYSQFGNRDNLMAEAMHKYVETKIADARAVMESGSINEQDRRAAMGKLLAASADDESTLVFWTELWLRGVRDSETGQLLATEARAVDDVIADSIRTSRGGGAENAAGISDDALATVVSSLFRGLAQRRRIDPASVPDELLGKALQLLVAGRQSLHRGVAKPKKA